MNRRRSLVAGLAACAAGLALAVLATAALVSAEDPATAWSEQAIRARFPDPDAGAAEDGYAGNFECEECHADRVKSLGTSFHEALRNEAKSKSRGCESCHGPGMVHVDDEEQPIRHPAKADARTVIGACLVCHVEVLAKPIDGHREWIEGRDGALRSCVTCHLVHVDREAPEFDPEVGPFPSRRALAEVAKPLDAAVCATCHTSFHPEMRSSGHAFLLTEGEQCAACHGNGSLHALSAGDPRKILRPDRMAVAETDGDCMECHRAGDSVARWTCAEHSREKIACVVCHDPNARHGRTLRGSEFELCGGCHLDVKAKLRLPNGHRVERGRVKCTDCHDPHGNVSKLRDKDLRFGVCADCHVEKAGPFVHDHGIKRTEGCVSCHEPHGSTNRRMLAFTRVKPLCLQCHADAPHPLSERKYDNCISCHVEIHGSDLDEDFRR